MKKNFLSAIVIASIATATNATTYMNVEQEGGQVSSFDVEKVIQVTYGDAENTDVCVSSSEVEEALFFPEFPLSKRLIPALPPILLFSLYTYEDLNTTSLS
jgi:hypothetical protein